MSIANDELHTDREEGRKLYEESDKLLRLAEGLQDKCEQYERRWWLLLAVCVSTGMAFGTGAIYLTIHALQVGREDLVYNGWMWAAIVPFFYMVICAVYVYYMRGRIDRQVARERRALHGIVDLLRDIEKGIVETSDLSTIERAEFRIRLSRFDIGPGE